MKARHLLYDLLFFAIVNAGHISIVTIDYTTISMYQDESYCGLHDSAAVLDVMGAPKLPTGAKKIIQQELHRKYIQERDEYRRRRGDVPIWELDSSMTHASTVYEVHRALPNTISSRVRTIYDKGYHGGNRARTNP